jgi:sugar phosphate isomerase/epimerase
MAAPVITPDSVGLCLSTLHPAPYYHEREDVARMVRIAAAAGFPSLVFQRNWAASIGAGELRQLLDDEGLFAGALESSMNWCEGPEGALRDADEMLDTASTIGARLLHAACMAQTIDMARAAEGFAALCERAGANGLKVSLEFIPLYAIPDLTTAWQIVQASGAANGGICLDWMHWQRQPGGPDPDLLRSIPGQHISYVQPTGTPAEVTTTSEAYLRQCVTQRPLPDDGNFDTATFLDCLAQSGAQPYVAYQVCNTAMAEAGAEQMAAALRANAAQIFG